MPWNDELSSDTSSSCEVESLQLTVEGEGAFNSIVWRYRRVVEEGDVTEEDEDDEDGIRFVTLESRFENKTTRIGRIRRFAVGPVYPNKSLTMCSSDFVFRKYKQDSAFRVSGVLQLAKTGPPVTKNFPLRRLYPSDTRQGKMY